MCIYIWEVINTKLCLTFVYFRLVIHNKFRFTLPLEYKHRVDAQSLREILLQIQGGGFWSINEIEISNIFDKKYFVHVFAIYHE